MDIPPLSSSFLFVGFINLEMIQGNENEVMVDIVKTFESLSIDMVEVEDQEAKDARLPPFPRGQTLNNWTPSNSLLSLNSKTINDYEQPDALDRKSVV